MRENGDSWRAIDDILGCKSLEAYTFYKKATQKVKKQPKKVEFTFETISQLREEERLTWREIGRRFGVKQHKASSYYRSELAKQNSPPVIKILAFTGNEIISKYPSLHLWGIHLLHNDGYSFREMGRYFGDNPSTIQNWFNNHIDVLATSSHPAEADEYDFDLVSIMRAMRWSWKKIVSFLNTTDAIKRWYNAELSEPNGKFPQSEKTQIKTAQGIFEGVRIDKSVYCCPVCGGKKAPSKRYCSRKCSRVENIDKSVEKSPSSKCPACDKELGEGEDYCSQFCVEFDKKRGRLSKAKALAVKLAKNNVKAISEGTKMLTDVALRKKRQEDST